MAKLNYAIELTDNTVIYKAGYGIILSEPSILVVKEVGNKYEVVCAGNDALLMLGGKCPKGAQIVKPIENGVLKNKAMATLMLTEFFKKINVPLESKNCLLLHISGISAQEKNDMVNLMYGAGARDVVTLPLCFAGLTQMDINVFNSSSYMLVNLSNIVDISVVNNGEILQGCSIDIGANMLDVAIKEYVYDNYNGDISLFEAKNIRQEIATLLANDVSNIAFLADDINGFGTINVVLESQEIRGLLTEVFNKICGAIEGVLSICPASVVEDIKRNGVYLCGELCTITGVERYMKGRLSVPVFADSEPNNTIIMGGGAILNNPQLLNELNLKK